MKIQSTQTTVVNLSLTEQEADWLMGFVQNYSHQDVPEISVEAALREALYNGLRTALYPNKTPVQKAL